jgi:hypothetical protein
MANKIILKKSSVTSKVPLTTDLEFGELALNYADGRLYFKKSDGTTIDFFTTATAAVSSVDGNTGDVTSAQLLTAIKKEDGVSSGLDADLLDGQHGAYYLDWANVTNKPTTVELEHSQISSNSATTSSVSQVSVDSFPSATYRSAKYYVQMTSGSAYHVIEISLLHDGTDVNLVQYGEIRTGASLGTFDASITSGTLNLLFTPTNATTTVKLTRTAIEV